MKHLILTITALSIIGGTALAYPGEDVISTPTVTKTKEKRP